MRLTGRGEAATGYRYNVMLNTTLYLLLTSMIAGLFALVHNYQEIQHISMTQSNRRQEDNTNATIVAATNLTLLGDAQRASLVKSNASPLGLSPSNSNGKELLATDAGERNASPATPHENIPESGTASPSHQQLAVSLLKRMEQRGALNTPISTRNNITQPEWSTRAKVFPRKWKACVLSRILQQKSSIKITVMGGSTAARPGNNCTKDPVNNPHGGRYSNILEENLRADSNSDTLQFTLANMGQGGEISKRGALFLDRYLDSTTDVLVWDYFVNDNAVTQRDTQQQIEALEFWLTRVGALYAPASPPPIVLLYLWEFRAATRLVEGEIQAVDKNPMEFMGSLIDSYRSQGWDIAVINVGAAVDSNIVKTNTSLLFDDSSHPSCQGTRLIADLLEHTIVSNLAANSEKCSAAITTTSIPSSNKNHILPSGTKHQQLWQDLWNPQATVASLSPWEPHISKVVSKSNLRISSAQTVFGQRLHEADAADKTTPWPMASAGKSDPSREDRKLGYRIPGCTAKHPPLRLVLEQPNLKWIGMSVLGPGLQITINNNATSPTATLELPDSSQWINLQDMVPAPTTTLNICHNASPQQLQNKQLPDPNLQYLLGVSIPKLTIQ